MNTLTIQEGTLTTIQLYEIVNTARSSAGEKEIRSDAFMIRVKDELEGELGFPQMMDNPQGGRPRRFFTITHDQAMLVGMRESKAVRRKVMNMLNDFKSKQQPQQPDLATDEGKLLMIQELASQQLVILAENKQLADERDEAIRTKAHIGSRREASAMATASVASRQVKQLKNELGWGAEFATVRAVENALNEELPSNAYVGLRKWCRYHAVPAQQVPDKRYGHVMAWPAGVWREIHGICLVELFGNGEASHD